MKNDRKTTLVELHDKRMSTVESCQFRKLKLFEQVFSISHTCLQRTISVLVLCCFLWLLNITVVTRAHALVSCDSDSSGMTVSMDNEALTLSPEEKLLDVFSHKNLPDSKVKNFLFVDQGVAHYDALVSDAAKDTKVVVIDAMKDGVEQISQILVNYRYLDSIQILSHGQVGTINLGSAVLNKDTITQYTDELSLWGDSLRERGDILLYGCNVGLGDSGRAFIHQLGSITGADIAASTNATGASKLGGDWVLESTTGEISASLSFTNTVEYQGLLPAPIVLDLYTGMSGNVYVRPGGPSYTWTVGTGWYPPGGNGATAQVTQVDYHNVDWNPPTEDWILTIGKFQYSTNGGTSWIDYPMSLPFGTSFVSVAGTVWRFVHNNAGDTTTTQALGNAYYVEGYASSIGATMWIYPDNEPSDIWSDTTTIFSGIIQGTEVAGIGADDTGLSTGGVWEIESQSVADLFTLTPSNRSATLSIGTGAIPAVGQTATITVRYYDLYQTDDSGNPIPGEGISKQLTYTVVAEQTKDLAEFGDDIKISTTTDYSQTNPDIATLSNGNFAVVWQSNGDAVEITYGIYGQIYDASGNKVGSEFLISNTAGVDETTPAIAALDSGRFAVTYAKDTGDIGYRLIEANGVISGEFIANTTADADSYPAVATLTDGSFVITWGHSSTYYLYAQKINAADGSKNGGEITIDNSGLAYYPSIAGLSNGEYVIAWRDDNYNVNAVLSSDLSTNIAVVTDASVGDFIPSAAGLTGGGFVVSWGESYANDMTDYNQTDVFFQRYNSSGVPQGATVQANNSSATLTNHTKSTIAALSGGGFVIAWESDTGDYDPYGIFGRRFTSTGVAVDVADFQINQHRLGSQYSPRVVGLAADNFGTVWVDGTSDTDSAGIEGRVTLGSLNNAPSDITLSSNTINQSSTGPGSIVGGLTTTDADGDDTHSYSLVSNGASGTGSCGASGDDGNASFQVDNTNDDLETADTVVGGSYNVCIQTNDGTDTFQKTFAITVGDDVAPTANFGSATDNVGSVTGSLISGDTTDDTALVLAGTNETSSTVNVYNGVSLLGAATISGTNWSYTAAVADGTTYQFNVIETDAAGNTSSATTNFTVIGDMTAPTANFGSATDDAGTITGILSSGDTTDDTALALAGTNELGSTVHVYNGASLLGAATVSGTSWSYSATIADSTTYQFNVIETDAAGNASSATSNFTVIGDTVAPTANFGTATDDAGTVTGALSNGDTTDDTALLLAGSNESGSIVNVYNGASLLGAATISGTSWSYMATVADGTTYQFNVRETDTVGNTSSATSNFTVTGDMTAPTATFGSATDDVGAITGVLSSGDITDDTALVLAGTNESGSTVYVYNGASLLGAATVSGTSWSYSATIADATTYQFNVIEMDAAGNESAATSNFTVTGDTTAPTANFGTATDDVGTVTGVLSNGDTTDDTALLLAGTNELGSTVNVYNAATLLGAATVSGTNWSYTAAVADGVTYLFNVRETDTTGIISSATSNFTVIGDTVAPIANFGSATDNVGSITGPLSSGDTTDDTALVLAGTNELGSIVNVYNGAALLGAAAVSGTSWSYTAAVADGTTYQFNVRETDTTGLVSSATSNFTVIGDTVAPIANFGSATDNVGSITGLLTSGDTTDDTALVLAGTNELGSTVNVYNGAALLGAAAVSGTSWSYTAAVADGTTYQFNVIETDGAGNSSSATSNFTVTGDITSPATPSVPDMTALTDNGVSTTDNKTSDTTPTFIGTAEVGATVTLTSSINGLIGSSLADGSGAWMITSSALNYTVHNISASAQDIAGNISSPSGLLSVVINHDPTFTDTPTIIGILEINETLSLLNTSVADVDSGDSVTLSYQWLRNGSDITGATSDSYVLQTRDKGSNITCRLSAHDLNGGEAIFVTGGVKIEGGFPWSILLQAL